MDQFWIFLMQPFSCKTTRTKKHHKSTYDWGKWSKGVGSFCFFCVLR